MAEYPVFKIGLTGGIGMGKTTVADMLEKQGIPVFDSDHCVHNLLVNDQNLIAQIASFFPGAVENDRVNRKKLGAVVFGNKEKKDQLEMLIHPRVEVAQKDFMKSARVRKAGLAVFDIPLLFETGSEARMDKVITVSAPSHIQRKRVLKRPDMTEERLDHILGAQYDDMARREKADFVIHTDCSLEETRKEVKKLAVLLKKMPKTGSKDKDA